MIRAAIVVDFLAIGFGGALGAMLRYGFTRLAILWPGCAVWGTLAANLLGCFAIGILAGFLQESHGPHGRGELAMRAGFLGGLTTFSTFALEVVLYAGQQKWGMVALQLAGNLGLGILVLLMGIMLGRMLNV